MSELKQAMSLLNRKFPTCIQKCTNHGAEWFGRFSFVGALPAELSEEVRAPGRMPRRRSFSYATEQEAIDALLSVGIVRFQLSDCSWFGATPTKGD